VPRRSWVYIDGVAYERGVDPVPERARTSSVAFIPDLPDFVSPIDGKCYSGRAGMREHCAVHDVVPTRDLAGLPTVRPTIAPQGVKDSLISVARQRGYL
jgi:hypothetical protein